MTMAYYLGRCAGFELVNGHAQALAPGKKWVSPMLRPSVGRKIMENKDDVLATPHRSFDLSALPNGVFVVAQGWVSPLTKARTQGLCAHSAPMPTMGAEGRFLRPWVHEPFRLEPAPSSANCSA